MYTASLELVRSPTAKPHRKHTDKLQIIKRKRLEHVEHPLHSYNSQVERERFYLWIFDIEELDEAYIGKSL